MVTRTSHKVTLHVRYQSGCTYERLLRTCTARYDTVTNIMSKQPSAHSTVRGSRQTASSNIASAARFLTSTRDPFSPSNQKKSLMAHAKSVLVQACRNGKNQTARLRYETNRTSSQESPQQLWLFYQSALYRKPWD